MHIKQSTVIPAGIKITKCPTKEGKGKSVWSLLRAEERKLEKEAEIQQWAKRVQEYLKQGYTAQEALKLCAE